MGGPHDGNWADCTGTVYDVDIRHENAVHSLEHGAVWITYDPDEVSDADVETLAELVDGESGRMLSPYAGLDCPISLQAWNHQLKVDSVYDERIEQFADFLTPQRRRPRPRSAPAARTPPSTPTRSRPARAAPRSARATPPTTAGATGDRARPGETARPEP